MPYYLLAIAPLQEVVSGCHVHVYTVQVLTLYHILKSQWAFHSPAGFVWSRVTLSGNHANPHPKIFAWHAQLIGISEYADMHILQAGPATKQHEGDEALTVQQFMQQHPKQVSPLDYILPFSSVLCPKMFAEGFPHVQYGGNNTRLATQSQVSGPMLSLGMIFSG